MITPPHVIRYLDMVAARLIAQRDALTALDAAIGDGDHGINMSRGFEAVRARLPGLADEDIGAMLKATGSTLISTVGGASGPLYGTAFLRAAAPLAGLREIALAELVLALDAAVEGIKLRGRVRAGEKTMLDALEPAALALRSACERGLALGQALRACAEAAEQGMRATIPLLATKGRASYLGERSLGHQDPGATSAALMIAAMAECCTEHEA